MATPSALPVSSAASRSAREAQPSHEATASQGNAWSCGQRGGVAFGGNARSDERFAFSEEFGVDDAPKPDDLAIFAVHAEFAAVLFVAPDITPRSS